MTTRKGTVKLWFDYLQMAAKLGLEVNWAFYAPWGTKAELTTISFNRWWITRGRDLFEKDSVSTSRVTRVENTRSDVVVRIPLDMPLDVIKAAVRDIVLAARPKVRIGGKGRFAVSGQVNYKSLAQYKRFLEIDLYWGSHETTTAEKAEELVRRYQRFSAKGVKQRQTLRQAGKAKTAMRFHNRDPEELTRKDIGRINPKRVNRWRLSGKHILLNVADGKFPGDGYHGSKLNERLLQRMNQRGIVSMSWRVQKSGRRRKLAQMKSLGNK